MIQRTLVLVKPDGMKRGLAGEIISRMERIGLKIVKAKLAIPDREFALKHYPVTEEWLTTAGNRTISDCEKYGVDVKEAMGTDSAEEIGKLLHSWNVEFFTDQEILALVFEGINAIEAARKLAGSTMPLSAAPGTIRGDYATGSALSENTQKRTIYNLVHTSGSEDEAKREISLWFEDK